MLCVWQMQLCSGFCNDPRATAPVRSTPPPAQPRTVGSAVCATLQVPADTTLPGLASSLSFRFRA